MTGDPKIVPSGAGLVQGGLGGSEDELMETGQEEVFARTEVETGRIEHAVIAGSSHPTPVPSGKKAEADPNASPKARRQGPREPE